MRSNSYSLVTKVEDTASSQQQMPPIFKALNFKMIPDKNVGIPNITSIAGVMAAEALLRIKTKTRRAYIIRTNEPYKANDLTRVHFYLAMGLPFTQVKKLVNQ
jgi:hypothetical protein